MTLVADWVETTSIRLVHLSIAFQLRSEVADGLLYAHSRANSNTAKLLEVSAFAYAAIELLAEKGLIDFEILDRK